MNKSEATKRSRDRKENGKCTNATNRRSRDACQPHFTRWWLTLSDLNVSTLQPGLSLWKLKASQLKHKHGPSFHMSFGRRGSNWKIRLFPKPVRRIPKTSRFCATVSRHSFCSRFKPDIWRKCCMELLKAASNSSEAIVDGLDKNYANLQAVVKIRQLFISELSTVIDSTNQILIPGADIMERRHQWNVYRLPCALPPHQTALGSSRSP